MDICPKCGLPSQACVCKEIVKTQQQIEVKTEKRRFGKISTLISGVEESNIKDVAKKLKSELACGGTVKKKVIGLQGNHKSSIKPILIKMGFEEEQIKD